MSSMSMSVGQAQRVVTHDSGCIAFTFCSRHGVSNIFVLLDGAGGDAPPVAVTAHTSPQLSISSLAFTADGRSIVFVTQFNGAATLWISAVPSSAADLTDQLSERQKTRWSESEIVGQFVQIPLPYAYSIPNKKKKVEQ